MLSKTAKSASWSGRESDFKEVREGAFTFLEEGASHHIVIVKPKPGSDTIRKMLVEYYNEQAEEYDDFDLRDKTRRAYTDRIDNLVAEEISHTEGLSDLLVIACGTGRRAKHIKKLSGREFDITGIDMSEEMCKKAMKKGLHVINKKWLDVPLSANKQFDAAMFLYSFGHIPTREERIKSLLKVNRHLKKGGSFYFDAFNIDDNKEWGPLTIKAFEEDDLGAFGYERGDVFYQKTGGKSIAFLHYFNEQEIRELLAQTGFYIEKMINVGYIYRSGEILRNNKEGFFFVKAVKGL